MQTKFTVIPFEQMSWPEWKAYYFSDIRVNHELGTLKNPKTGIILADADTEIYIPWYKKGGWRYGEPKKITPGNNLILLRCAAVKYKGKFLALDSIHRLTMLKPAMIVIDWVEVKESQRKYVTDLITDFWD